MTRIGRAGSMSQRQSRRSTMKGPSKDSNTSRKRANRGFRSLEESSRIHRRAKRRSEWSRNQYGKVGKPGERMDGGAMTFIHIAGGSIKYY